MSIKIPTSLSPFRVVLFGTVLVALLLLLPISVPELGSHDGTTSCGNALTLDLGMDYDPAEPGYWHRTQQNCTTRRITRLALAVGAVAVTGLFATFVVTRPSRRRATVAADGARQDG